MPRRRFVLLLLPAFAACFPSPQPYDGPSPEGSPYPFVGCYEATFSGGGRGLPRRRATASIQRHDDPYWTLIPGGIQMHIGDSLHGSYFDFTPTADGLAGRAFHYSDTASGFGVEPVTARRVECTAEWDRPGES